MERPSNQVGIKFIKGFQAYITVQLTARANLTYVQPHSQALSRFTPMSSRRETRVAAGHVSMYTNQSCTRGGSSTKFFNRTIQFCLGEGKL